MNNDPITALWYHPDTDILISCSTTYVALTRDLFLTTFESLDENLRDVVRSNMDIQVIKQLNENTVDDLVSDLMRRKENPRSFSYFETEWNCLEMTLKALRDSCDESTYNMLKDTLAEKKQALIEYIQEGRLDIEKKMADARIAIIEKFDKYLPKGEKNETAFEEMDHNYERELKEMQERHRRELEQLNRRYKSLRKRVEKECKRQMQRCAKMYYSVRTNYENRLEILDREGQVQVRRLIESIGVVDQDEIDPNVTLAPRYKFICLADPESNRVFKAIDFQTHELVAIKCLPTAALHDSRRLVHPSLVTVRDILVTDVNSPLSFVVMDLMQSNLRTFIAKNPTHFHGKEDLVAQFAFTILKGLKYLHGEGMVHRDLRPGNIMITEQGEPRLIHLGLMKSITGVEKSENRTMFAAPELFARTISPESDIWSMGCVLVWLIQTPQEREKQALVTGTDSTTFVTSILELANPSGEEFVDFREFIIKDVRARQFFENLSFLGEQDTKQKIAQKASLISQEALSLISAMLRFHPAKRISVDEALNHEFFRKYNLVFE
jgi:flagellar motility protein MotE (MotC chaperone)